VSKRTIIFIPTYNERGNVEPLCERIMRLHLDADVLFMDDSSPDGTGDVLDEMARSIPRLSVIHRPAKSGIGSAHVDGIALAYDRGYDRLVTLDADFTHSPETIPAFLRAADASDVVVGSRHLEADSLPGWTPIRKALTVLGHVLTRTMLGLKEDASGAFRVYNLETIPREVFDLVASRGYAFFFESLFVLNNSGFRIAEVPIKLPARTQGHSKMSYAEIGRSLWMLAALYAANRRTPTRYRWTRGRPPRTT
jgi:dolichol-phosphate mannosyltransferase